MIHLGWTALLVPEELGGLGLGFIELAAVMEEMGGSLACAPLFSTVCLATNLLLLADGEAPQRQLLTELAAGRLRATVAFTAAEGRDGVHARKAGSWQRRPARRRAGVRRRRRQRRSRSSYAPRRTTAAAGSTP